MKFEFSIIIPNYNGAKFLETCLNSLLISIKKVKDIEYEIILVDNDSHDNSLTLFQEFIQKHPIKFKIIKNSKNLGFAGAVNQGIKKSSYSWVILLNNDLTFHPDWFKHILQNFPQNNLQNLAAVFGTVLNYTGEKIESQGLRFFSIGKAKNIGNGQPYLRSKIYYLKSSYVWGASAALVIYQKEIIQKIGLFDEDFFAYEEDVDLAYRLNLLHYQTFYIPQALSYHLGGGTSSKMGNFRYRMDAKNWIYLITKNYSASQILSQLPQIFIERLRNLSGLIKSTRPLYHLPADLIKTYGEIFTKLPKMFKKRRDIQKLLKSLV